MEPLRHLKAVAAPLDLANINTDQLFPARFIKKPRAVGYAQYAFHDIRRDEQGSLRAEFVLNQPRFSDAKILVAGPNFGSGSSREGAVYTLYDAGFRVILAPSFGEIFASNCLKNGVLAATLPSEIITHIQSELVAGEPIISVDLESETLQLHSGEHVQMPLDPFQKKCLMEGLNEIDLSLQYEGQISQFERTYRERFPWMQTI